MAEPRRWSAKRSPDAATSYSSSARSSPKMRPSPGQSLHASIACGASAPIASISICCTGAATCHWRKRSTPLPELVDAGKIRYWGVSNFDVVDMIELWRLGGAKVATDQVLYNLTRRGIEYDLMPSCLDRRIPIMAYSPLEQGRLLGHSELKNVAARHNATPAQIALAWLLRQDGVVAIPKAANVAHVQENHAALELHLTREDLAALDRAFPPPTEALPLAML